jgi:hypothetical protein
MMLAEAYSHGGEPSESGRAASSGDCAGPLESSFEIIEDVLATHLRMRGRCEQHVERAGLHFREKNRGTVAPASLDDVAQDVQRRRVERRHVTHSDDQHFRLLRNAREGVLEPLGGTEEEGPVDLVDDDARRMNKKAASTMPTSIATVRSTSTVRMNVASRTTTSDLGDRSSARNERHSLM